MLTAYEISFIHHYKVSGNATQAIMDCGFKGKRVSAHVKANRIMRKPEVQAVLKRTYQETVTELSKPLIITDTQVLRGIPTKDEVIIRAWERTVNTEHSKKEETRAKYLELAGKAVGAFAPESQTLNVFAGAEMLEDVRSRLQSLVKQNLTGTKIIDSDNKASAQHIEDANKANTT